MGNLGVGPNIKYLYSSKSVKSSSDDDEVTSSSSLHVLGLFAKASFPLKGQELYGYGLGGAGFGGCSVDSSVGGSSESQSGTLWGEIWRVELIIFSTSMLP